MEDVGCRYGNGPTGGGQAGNSVLEPLEQPLSPLPRPPVEEDRLSPQILNRFQTISQHIFQAIFQHRRT